MKYLSIISLFLFIVVFPLGSWYYLQQGFDYRKAALEDLRSKGDVSDIFSEEFINDYRLRKKSSLILLPSSKLSSEHVDKIFDQFRKAYTFQMLNFADQYNESSLAKHSNWVNMSSDMEVDIDGSFIILDNKGNIRNTYVNEDEEMKKMIEHLSIVIPSRPQRDIVEKK